MYMKNYWQTWKTEDFEQKLHTLEHNHSSGYSLVKLLLREVHDVICPTHLSKETNKKPLERI